MQRKWRKFLLSIRGSLSSRHLLLQFLVQTIKEIKARKVNFCLGFLACFLVVMVVAFMVTILANAPVIFLRLAELTQGETDVILSAGDWSGYGALNYTLISGMLKEDTTTSYNSPRYQGETFLYTQKRCAAGLDPNDSTWKYLGTNTTYECPDDADTCSDADKIWCYEQAPGKCFQDLCGTSAFQAKLYVVDSAKEKRIGIGREWTLGSIQEGKVFMISDIAAAMGLKEGSVFYMHINMSNYMPGVYEHVVLPHLPANATVKNSSAEVRWGFWNGFIPLRVQTIYRDPVGKHPLDEENVIIMEYAHFLPYITRYLHPKLPEPVSQEFKQINLYDFAQQVVINLPPPRIQFYLQSDYDKIQRAVVEFSARIVYKLGFSELLTDMPVTDSLNVTQYFSLFLGLILNVVILILLLLSTMLIYSLLMVNVETRTFEMGVYRLVGATRGGIVQLLLMQAFSYAVPSWVCGLLFSEALMMGVSVWFKEQTGVPMEPVLTPLAVFIATLLGIFVPVVSAIFPIRHALGQNLHDSLDTKRQKVQAVSVDLERSEDKSFSWSLMIIGLSLSGFGFAVYYVVPLSLLTMDLTLLLNIFFFILIGMLMGLVLLSLNLEPLLERLLVNGLLFWEKATIRAMVIKNLVAHRKRNTKTTIMYALSLGFIIFIMVSYNNLLDGFAYQREQSSGVYLKVMARGTVDKPKTPLDWRHHIRNVQGLEDYLRNHTHIIKDHSWVTHHYNDAWQDHGGPVLENLGRSVSDTNQMQGVAPNFMDVLFNGFLILNEGSEYNGLDMSLSEQLYTPDGSSRAWVGTRYKDFIGLRNTEGRFMWRFSGQTGGPADDSAGSGGTDGGATGGNAGGGGNANPGFVTASPRRPYEDRVVMRPLAFFDAAPFFRFSKFNSRYQHTAVSFTTWLRQSEWTTQSIFSVDDLPWSELLFKIDQDDAEDKAKREQIKSDVNKLIKGQEGVYIYDLSGSSNPIQKADNLLTAFFGFTTAVAMLIASFSLVSSMYTNIYEQTKEIGVVRAIGMRQNWLKRIYMYEAFILVLSSSLLGIIIGSAVGYTLLLQRILFTQLALPFRFPWQILIIVFTCSLIFAFVSSFGPITTVMKRSIVQILRY